MTGSAKQSIARAVIASEAKQSISPRKEGMDCFAALAMTVSGRWHSTARHTLSRHRPLTGRASARSMTSAGKLSFAPAVLATEVKQSIAPQRKNGLLRCARNDGLRAMAQHGTPHSQSSSPANRPRECAPDDRLREAIHRPAVIASAAKQSISPRKERVDCFAALAMTVSGRWHSTARHTLSRHRPPTGRASARPMTSAAKQSIAPAVIASEAKQSIAPQRKNGLLRCARNDGLGAMAQHGTPHSQSSSPANRPRECAPDDRLREAIHRPRRHCERSEAIHLAAQRRNGLLRCARNDGLRAMAQHGTPHSQSSSSANRPRECALDDKRREAIFCPCRPCYRSEAIHRAAKKEWIASLRSQ